MKHQKKTEWYIGLNVVIVQTFYMYLLFSQHYVNLQISKPKMSKQGIFTAANNTKTNRFGFFVQYHINIRVLFNAKNILVEKQ